MLPHLNNNFKSDRCDISAPVRHLMLPTPPTWLSTVMGFATTFLQARNSDNMRTEITPNTTSQQPPNIYTKLFAILDNSLLLHTSTGSQLGLQKPNLDFHIPRGEQSTQTSSIQIQRISRFSNISLSVSHTHELKS